MDLLSSDEEEEKQAPREAPQHPSQNAVHLYDQLGKNPEHGNPPRASVKADAPDSIIQKPAETIARPPTQTNPQPSQADVLTLLVRAQLKGPIKRDPVTPEDTLVEHALTCKDDACTQDRCQLARRAYQHYQMCNKDVCNTCSNARLYVTRAKNGLAPQFEEEYKAVRGNLLKALDALKRASAATKTASGNDQGGSNHGVSASEELKRCHERYTEAKTRYEDALRKLYTMWKREGTTTAVPDARPLALAPSSRSPVVPTTAASSNSSSGLLVSAAPVGSVAKSSTNVAVASGTHVQPVAVDSASKRSEELLNGFAMSFILGDTANSMVEDFEGVLENLTNSVAKPTQWRVPSDFTEPDWSESNILTKREIEEEGMSSGSKRLFSSLEMEYISRSAQEVVVGVIAGCVERAKHRRFSSGDDAASTILIDVSDLKPIISQESAALKVLFDQE